mmetsp:Transcript_73397/g.174886  ORF Transcript_73397/g.174886 Transcript_73397/m.174886 type:complete len:303 (+) Transcript_73397:1225-2133(+)
MQALHTEGASDSGLGGLLLCTVLTFPCFFAAAFLLLAVCRFRCSIDQLPQDGVKVVHASAREEEHDGLALPHFFRPQELHQHGELLGGIKCDDVVLQLGRDFVLYGIGFSIFTLILLRLVHLHLQVLGILLCLPVCQHALRLRLRALVCSRWLLQLHAHVVRVAHARLHQVLQLAGESGAEETRSPLPRQPPQDVLNVAGEAHVQESVCLVQDQDLKGLEAQDVVGDMIHGHPKTARCGDDDLQPPRGFRLAKLLRCSLHLRATDNNPASDARARAGILLACRCQVLVEHLIDLANQLASGS